MSHKKSDVLILLMVVVLLSVMGLLLMDNVKMYDRLENVSTLTIELDDENKQLRNEIIGLRDSNFSLQFDLQNKNDTQK